MNHAKTRPLFRPLLLLGLLGAIAATGGCKSTSEETAATDPGPSLAMDLPDSLTGGRLGVASALQPVIRAQNSNDVPCAYLGVDDDDIFRNGYNMTRFMVSAVATWTCIADTLIDVAATVPHDGLIRETENDLDRPGYDADKPTHYSVSDDSATQTTARLYYGYHRAQPPAPGDKAQFYISWSDATPGTVSGRLIIDAQTIDYGSRKPQDPVAMRMDFDFDGNRKLADMFLKFDQNNDWAEGVRIEVTRDLDASPLGQVYLARGLMAMKRQFIETAAIGEVPQLKAYTVSDRIGRGAAIADIQDIGLELPLGPVFGGETLGAHLFTKDDRYFFDEDSDWDYVHKEITHAAYKGGSTASAQTVATIDGHFVSQGLLSGGELAACLASSGDNGNCVALLNAIFEDGFAGQEPNQGYDPQDWRSAAIASPAYLSTVYPNGTDWSGAFDQTFNP